MGDPVATIGYLDLFAAEEDGETASYEMAFRESPLADTDWDGKPPQRAREVRIKVDRMRPTSNGYRLVEEAPCPNCDIDDIDTEEVPGA